MEAWGRERADGSLETVAWGGSVGKGAFGLECGDGFVGTVAA